MLIGVQLLHPGISSLTHPIKQKKGLHWFMAAIFGTTLICYMTLCVHHPLLPSQACRVTPYRAHHPFKLHFQPGWIRCKSHMLQSPGLPSQLCSGFQCGGLGPLHPCVHLCPDAPPWHPQPHPPHQAEEGAPLVHGGHLWHHPLLLHDTGNSGVLVVQRGINETASLNWVRADVYVCTCV